VTSIARARKVGRYEPLQTDTGNLETLVSASPAPNPEHLAFARELGALLETAVDALVDGCREVFVLREVQGMSTLATAQVLGGA
jgi:DNA-directed RNA polymerase specialized sigma24 family protein